MLLGFYFLKIECEVTIYYNKIAKVFFIYFHTFVYTIFIRRKTPLKVFKSIQNFSKIPNAVVTIGTFDGIHTGHKKIIARLREIASSINGETVVVSFFPHPRLVLFPDDNDLKLLNTEEEKTDLLAASGIDNFNIIDFTKEFSRMSSLEFVRDILVNGIGAKKLVIGYDHHFGRNREGSLENLRELAPLYGFEVEEIPAQDINNIAISSTKIRNALLLGNIATANSFLGYNYSLSGNVVKGNQLGKTIGFPTANIAVKSRYKLIPANGVYAVKVKVADVLYDGMLNIGVRPTVNGQSLTIEANIFAFDAIIYDETITVYFVDRIRNEMKFSGLESLKEQLKKDKEYCTTMLSKNKNEYAGI